MAVYTRKVKDSSGKVRKYYAIEIWHKGKIVHRKNVGAVGVITKAEARRQEQELKAKFTSGRNIRLKPATLSEIIPEYIDHCRNIKKNRTWKLMEQEMSRHLAYFGDRTLGEIRSRDIQDYKIYMTKSGFAPATINRRLAFLGAMYNYAIDVEKYEGTNPVSIAKLLPIEDKYIRVLSYEEQDRFYKHCPDWFKPFFDFALMTGYRVNTIRCLKWEYVDLENNVIVVPGISNKNKKEHRLPIGSQMRQLLLKKKLQAGPSEYVFPEIFRICRNNVTGLFQRICKKAGISKMRFHDLRHTVGSRLADMGYDVTTIKEILGHSSIQTTQIYVHPEKRLTQALEDLTKIPDKSTDKPKDAQS